MSAQFSMRSKAARMPVIRPVEDAPSPADQGAPGDRAQEAQEAAAHSGPAVQAVPAVEGHGAAEAPESPHSQEDQEAARAAREEERARHALDVAHMAHLIEDMLTEAGATSADRQAIAEHLTGRGRLELHGPRHDSWMVTTALAQAWHTYSQRADLSAGVLLSILDGACGMVTDYIDVRTATRILQATHQDAAPEEVAGFIHWLERGDVWDDSLTDAQVRAAWARYRDQRHESAGAA